MRVPGVGALSVPRETALVVGLVSGSHVVNHTYLVLFPPILGVLAAEFDVSLAMLGVAMGVQAFVNTAFQLPYGHLADTRDRTLALGLCLGLGAAGVFVVAAAPTFAWVLAGQALLGAGVAGHHPAHFPLLADATPEQHRGRAFSVHGFAGNVGFAAPPVVITAVIAVPGLGWRHAFGLLGAVGLAFGLAAVAVLRTRVGSDVRLPAGAAGGPGPDAVDDGPSTRRDRLAAGLRDLLSAPGILGLGLFALVASTTMWGVTSYLVVILTDGYGVALGTANLALSATFVVGAGFILAGGDLADRVRPGVVILASYLGVAAFVWLLASMALPPLAAAACGVLGGSLGSLSLPARDKLADTLSERDDLGRNFAVVTVGIMIGNTIAPPAFGWLIGAAGLRPTFAAIGCVALLAVGVLAGLLRLVGPDPSGPAARGAGGG